MYCRNCGSEIKRKDGFCTECGLLAKKGDAYCPYCGQKTDPGIVLCENCSRKIENPEYSKKSRSLAGHLGIFFGFLGIHNFYLGYVSKGIVKIALSTFGLLLCGMGPVISVVWGWIEGIFILCDNINYDAKGRKLRKIGEKRPKKIRPIKTKTKAKSKSKSKSK